MTLYIATFAATADNDDTWDSAISHIIGYWANGTDDPTQGKEKIDVSLSSTDTFTFRTGENNRGIMLYVLARG
jgi:hypothetical protein